MTIDERIEKLTERHEALAISVEHLVAEGKLVDERLAKAGERLDKAGALIIQLTDAMTRLAHIVGSHEHRITNLEGGAV
jgi:hypothetical protein